MSTWTSGTSWHCEGTAAPAAAAAAAAPGPACCIHTLLACLQSLEQEWQGCDNPRRHVFFFIFLQVQNAVQGGLRLPGGVLWVGCWVGILCAFK
jgi:hypothetical protein